MADSINDLLDENQKAAEQLLLNVTEAKDVIMHVNETFLKPMKIRVLEDSSKDLVEAFEELKNRITTETTEFTAYRDKYTDHFHHLERKVVELDKRVDNVHDSLVNSWDVLRASLEALAILTGEKDDEEEEHHGTLMEQLEEHMQKISQQHQKKSLLVQELHETTETIQDDVEESATQHDGAIDRLGQALAEKTENLQEVFRQLAEYHLEQEEEVATTIGEAIAQVAENTRLKLAEEVPGSLNGSAEDVVVGPFSEMIESATRSHESLQGEIEAILEKMREVTRSLDEVKPVLNTIESIG